MPDGKSLLCFPTWNISDERLFNLLQSIASILAEYSWIYNIRDTEIFVHHTLEKIPSDWVDSILPLSFDDYRKLPFGFMKDDWPGSLKKFIQICTELAEVRFPKDIPIPKYDDPTVIEKKIPLKKQKECAITANLVYKVCKEVKCHKVLDIGSGLGYLVKHLHQSFGLQCIGIDSIENFTNKAKSLIRNDPCEMSIHHETLTVKNDEDCKEKLQLLLKNVENKNPSCICRNIHLTEDGSSESTSVVMAGLHCCGDLMQEMMKLFCSISELKAFICVGCCYHKINLNDFPISQTASSSVNFAQQKFPEWHPCTPGLRLGAHATRSAEFTEKILLSTEKCLIFRAILECYIIKENMKWKKPKRRIRASEMPDFETYCDIMLQNDQEILSDSEKNRRKKTLNNLYASKEVLFRRVKVLLILQIMLQPLWELFVYLDRFFYFKEKHFACKVFTLWDDSFSPRNIALCAYKS